MVGRGRKVECRDGREGEVRGKCKEWEGRVQRCRNCEDG